MFSDRLRKADWEVRDVGIDIAKALIREYHYAKGTANTAVYTHGLFKKGEFWETNCQGVAWWMPPTKNAGLATYPENWNGVLCLSRLVILPNVPKNACTFLLARSVRLIDRKRWPCLLTYADSWRGHTGGIYRAAGWEYVGLSTPERTYTINGVMTCRKAGPTTRSHDEMIRLGAEVHGEHQKHKFRLLTSRRNDGELEQFM